MSAEDVPVEPDIYTKCAFGIELMELARSFGAKVKTEQDGCEFAEGVSVALAKCRLVLTHPAAASAEREALLDTVDALLDAVRKFVKKDTPTGLMRLNDAMVAAREAVAAARATKEV